tara:strand:- start:4744 stop:5055 length:312 start_codon:yes stop_codon:yes gene_type:complete
MSVQEMFRELAEEKIAPVVALEGEKKTTVLLFSTSEVCKKFAKRNLPKNWVNGELQAHEDDFNFVSKQGWDVEYFDWPRKVRNPELLNVVVLELSRETEVRKA